MGEGVGGGVGVGRRAILVFFGVWQGKRWAGGFFVFRFLFGGRLCGWAGFCVGVCEMEAGPLVCVMVGGVGVRQGCLVLVVCC